MERRSHPWLEGLAQPILNKTLLERVRVFQLSSFDSRSHHALQPNTSLAMPLTPSSLCFRNSRNRKIPTISSTYGLPWSSKTTPFQNILFYSFLLPWICYLVAVLILALESQKNPEVSQAGFVLKTTCHNPLSKWFSHLLFFDHAQFHCSKTCKGYEPCLCEDTCS